MKKWLAVVLACIACLALAGCAKSGGGTYSNILDYANRNGYNNWSYKCGDVADVTTEMVYSYFSGKYLDFTGQGYIQKDIWQPAVDGEIMAVFTCPERGEASVFVSLELVSLQETGSDGVAFYVTADCGNSYLYNVTLRGEELTAEQSFTVDVEKGQEICFVLSALTSNSGDKTRVDIRVEI